MRRKSIEKNVKSHKELYLKYRDKMYGVCLRYSGSSEEAEDLLHDGFIKVFENLKKYSGKGSLEGWLRKVFVNHCISKYHSKIKQEISYENLDIISDQEQPLDSYEESRHISLNEIISIIQKMPEGYRVIFNLYHIEGYSHKEIAEMLKIQVSTSTSQLLRAKNWLKSKIQKNKNIVYA